MSRGAHAHGRTEEHNTRFSSTIGLVLTSSSSSSSSSSGASSSASPTPDEHPPKGEDVIVLSDDVHGVGNDHKVRPLRPLVLIQKQSSITNANSWSAWI